LHEADAMRPERANSAEIQFCTAAEFGALPGAADGPLRTMLAMGGSAGLRTQ
jgi:hypothetical protein